MEKPGSRAHLDSVRHIMLRGSIFDRHTCPDGRSRRGTHRVCRSRTCSLPEVVAAAAATVAGTVVGRVAGMAEGTAAATVAGTVVAVAEGTAAARAAVRAAAMVVALAAARAAVTEVAMVVAVAVARAAARAAGMAAGMEVVAVETAAAAAAVARLHQGMWSMVWQVLIFKRSLVHTNMCNLIETYRRCMICASVVPHWHWTQDAVLGSAMHIGCSTRRAYGCLPGLQVVCAAFTVPLQGVQRVAPARLV